MNQLSLFDEPVASAGPPVCAPPKPRRPAGSTGELLKREGMQRAEAAKFDAVAHARGLAYDIARGLLPHADGQYRADGLVTMDDVQAAYQADAIERAAKGMAALPSLGNAAGRMFAGNPQAWEWTGEFTKSQRPEAHSNLLRVWRYKS